MIVITDGQDDSDVSAAHQLALTKNITIYALGIGDSVDWGQMLQITGDPNKVFMVGDFNLIGQILESICEHIG
jgi:hypothetical protein